MLNRKLRSITSALITAVLAVTGLVASAAPASAVGTANLYWIVDDLAFDQQVFSGSTASIPMSINHVTMSQTNNPGRGIGTDGTYLYYADNTNSTLVRSNLDGTNRVVVANITGGADGISVSGGYVYWAAWNGGIYGIATSATAGTPTQVIGPSLGGRPASGYSNVAVSGSDLYFSAYDGSNPSTLTPGVGLYHGTITALTAGSITKNSDVNGLVAANPGGGLYSDGSNLYMVSNANGRRGILKTNDWSQALSAWTFFDTSSVATWLGGVTVLGSDIFVTDAGSGKVYSMTTSGATLTQIYAGGAAADGYQIVALTPPSATVTFDANGGTGTMAPQTASSATNLTANAFTKTDHVFAYWSAAPACSFAYNNNGSYPFASSTTLYACWRGAGQVSETPGGAALTTYSFGNVSVNSSNTKTLFLKNIGDSTSLSGTISNYSISSGAGLTAAGAASGATPACNLSGGTLTYGQSCAITVTWAPTSAMTLTTSTHSLSIQFNGNFYGPTFSGVAAATKTVTYDANGGTGTMTPQVSAVAGNLTTNSITRTGYTFAGWNTVAGGSGTAYADAAQYAFGANVTLYAQWTAIPVGSSGGSVDSSIVRLGPVLERQIEPTATSITLTGFNLNQVSSVTINGVAATFKVNDAGSVTVNLPKLDLGACTVSIAGAGFSISMPAAFRVVAQATPGSTGTETGSGASEATFAVYFAPGSYALSAKSIATLKARTAALKAANGSVVITAWAQSTSNNRGDALLSANRAKAIATWLKTKGIRASVATGKGTLDAAATSRRADVTYLTK